MFILREKSFKQLIMAVLKNFKELLEVLKGNQGFPETLVEKH